MQFAVTPKTKSLQGTSDLTLVAPIKSGLAPALDARSYASRLRILLATLSAGRTSSQEAQPTPLIEDAIDRIRAIHAFRLAIVGEPQRPQLLLAVTFDGGWEPYMRRIWRDLGPLLDVIFCNCDGYLLSRTHSYAEYIAWVRSAQVGTEFVYTASPLTVNDLHYLRALARDPMAPAVALPPVPAGAPDQVLEQAWPALTALYRLADMHMPQGQPEPDDDADVLLRAAHHLLASAKGVLDAAAASSLGRTPTERAALQWFARKTRAEEERARLKNLAQANPHRAPMPAVFQPDKVQGGIVDQYPDMTHGCLLLVALEGAAAAQALFTYLDHHLTTGSQKCPGRWPFYCVNAAFTVQGLRVVGVPDATLEQMPIEFREGMAARASILGDIAHNHPTRWELPARNWPPAGGTGRVELSSVHVVVQFATSKLPSVAWDGCPSASGHPLHKAVGEFDALKAHGVHILSAQPTQRYISVEKQDTLGHFGYVDGLSQPSVGGPAPKPPGYANHVPLGDVLLGYENSLEDPPCNGPLWDDSTFVVFRKLRQDVAAFHELLAQSSLLRDEVKAQLMGRRPDGTNLITHNRGNDFDYGGDPTGAQCPFQSHVRRANPRTLDGARADMKAVPRIIRRGMSYGPAYTAGSNDDRGLMFMAYNASITEQFEVIQGWLSGGNASDPHSYSGLRDPFLGVSVAGDPLRFDFQGTSLTLPNPPLVSLLWGLYAFVPSVGALKELAKLAREAVSKEAGSACPFHRKQADDQLRRERAGLAMKGAAIIKGLQQIERQLGIDAAKTQWKIALEDYSARVSGNSQAVWAAVRELHGGVLRTPYGVLVCDRALVKQVYQNTSHHYSVAGYNERLAHSIGEIYLGVDDQAEHDKLAQGVNDAIYAVTQQQAFTSAHRCMTQAVRRHLPSTRGVEFAVEVKDLVDDALGAFCEEWFGFPDGRFVVSGGWSVGGTAPATCPGHFHSPSRYTFQPHPGPEAAHAGRTQGADLRNAVTRLVATASGLAAIKASRLGQPIEAAAAGHSALLVSNLIGAMMGMLPTVDGNLRGTLFEWMKDASLWDHQLAYSAAAGSAYARAQATLRQPLERSMQRRPGPELVWRTARQRHPIKDVMVEAGDTVVVSIVSATQQNLSKVAGDVDDAPEDRKHPLWPIFGGVRRYPSAAGQPLHACPGFEMAMGMLLGLLAGLVESATLRATLSPTVLKLSKP